MLSRVMEITAPGSNQLLFFSMKATEELGRPFEYEIDVLSESGDVDPLELLGQPVTVRLETAGTIPVLGAAAPSGDRFFNAITTRFGLVGIEGRYYRYKLTARPWLWLLTRTSDCRIWQNKKVPDIIKEIFGKYGDVSFEDKLTGSYREYEYCVQYRETDFNFVSRLMETEGIYYYFKHTSGKHTLILADSPGAHEPFPDYATVPFIAHDAAARLETEYVTNWDFTCEIQPGKYVIDDFDFKKPSTELRVNTLKKREHEQADHEFYDYPGNYKVTGDGENYVKIRLEELQAHFHRASGQGNPRGIATGYRFALTGHPRGDQNAKYIVVSTVTQLDYNAYEADGGSGANFSCSFKVIPGDAQFRSAPKTPKPHVQGPQTAIVTGPKGDEIYVDKFGRVKVQFHWDRLGKFDENSSCWIRVSHPWAGKNWGMIAIPRIGQEVIVDFHEGDPDQPVITGRVYNAEQMPPYDLPANMTQTGIKSRSSKKGTSANYNEIRFEDKKGAEEVVVHAERNMSTTVEVDDTQSVGNDRTITVDGKHTEKIKKDTSITILEGFHSTTVEKGDQSNTVNTGNQTNLVSKGNQVNKVDAGTQQNTVKGDITVESTSGEYKLTSPKKITLQVGGSSIVIEPGNITITSPKIDLNP